MSSDHGRQLGLFDAPPPAPGPDGARLRDEAIARVEANADDGWLEAALTAVRRVAERQRELTTDDLWRLVSPPREPRAAGAVMARAMKAGWVARTDRTVLSARRECHRRPVRVWRSLVYQGG